jgi:subtilisin family serine protease
MKRSLVAVASLVLGLGLVPPEVSAAPNPEGPHVPGELLVSFDPKVPGSERSQIHERRGTSVVRRFESIGVDLVRLPANLTATNARLSYGREEAVNFAEPNHIRQAHGSAPNDPNFGNLWGLKNTGQVIAGEAGTIDADIDASQDGTNVDAWDITRGSTAVTAALVDTGIDIGHPDLAANVWVNAGEVPGNGVDDDANGYVDDRNGWDFAHNDNSVYDSGEACGSSKNDEHGTHVAGIIGAVGNNGIGVAGVNWTVKLMPLKFLAKSGNQCAVGTDAVAIGAILYATERGVDVINLSWGGDAVGQALRQAMIAAQDAGILFAASAGNSDEDLSTNPQYPASFDLSNEIVVAASNNDDGLANFSNFGGPTDLAAPGVAIQSTISGSAYAFFSGTSMSAPFVSGTVALLRSQYPKAQAAELKERILSSVDAKPAFTATTGSGGRLNANSALRKVIPVVPTLESPNGGEILLPGSSVPVTWRTNLPAGNPTSSYRVESTLNARQSTIETNGFESGIPSSFTEPSDSDAAWQALPTQPHGGGSGTLSLRSGGVGHDEASWVTTRRTFPVNSTVSFWYRISSENCESPSFPVCGDYLTFLLDGVQLLSRAGQVGWNQASFRIPSGLHQLSWAYQKDASVVAGEDAAWIDDVLIGGVDARSWSLVGTTSAGATSIQWAVPQVTSGSAKLRACINTGSACSSSSDETDSPFRIGQCGQLNGPYWPGWDIARDLALRPNSACSGYVLDGWGGLHAFGGAPPASGPYWPGWDIARGVALHPNGGGYVLDGRGGVHRFGGAPAVSGTPYWPDWDIARAITISPDGTGGYVVDGYGGLHSFQIAGGAAPARPQGSPYWPGWDIAEGGSLHPDRGGYVLDGWGGIHDHDGAKRPSASPYWPGWDIARGMAVWPDGRGGYVLDGWGGLHPVSI